MKPTFFESPAEWRDWLEEHHHDAQALLVGFYKKASGKPSITWSESVDQALCFGWIDGVRKSIDEVSYSIRFTPRKARSTWSAVNIKKVEELERLGLMRTAGRAAFEKRSEERSGIYSYERANAELGAVYEKRLRANKKAWAFWQAQPPGYRRAASWWVISAKKEETRLRRLASLIEDSKQQRTIAPLTRPKKK